MGVHAALRQGEPMTRRRLLGTLAVGLVAGFLRVFPRRFLEEEPEEEVVHELYLSFEMMQRAFDRAAGRGCQGLHLYDLGDGWEWRL